MNFAPAEAVSRKVTPRGTNGSGFGPASSRGHDLQINEADCMMDRG